MTKVLNVCHIMESSSFTSSIYNTWSYLLDPLVLFKKSSFVYTMTCNLCVLSSMMELIEVELDVDMKHDVPLYSYI